MVAGLIAFVVGISLPVVVVLAADNGQGHFATPADTATLSDSLQIALGLSRDDAATLAESLLLGLPQGDAATLADSLQNVLNISRADAATLAAALLPGACSSADPRPGAPPHCAGSRSR
ncbi:MAG: hypothetical protein IID15_09445 [Candidatus Marinimicrobia bacterium]|nr:hypothetical protein [Candidatus Neomarinimicrobiota bacterium]